MRKDRSSASFRVSDGFRKIFYVYLRVIRAETHSGWKLPLEYGYSLQFYGKERWQSMGKDSKDIAEREELAVG